jgi:hypothetical protein
MPIKPRTVVIVDVSLSIRPSDLRHHWAILRQCLPPKPVSVILCDRQVLATFRVPLSAGLDETLRHNIQGGGSDLRPAFDLIGRYTNARAIKRFWLFLTERGNYRLFAHTQAIIVSTDGDTMAPERWNGPLVAWLLPQDAQAPAAFGVTLVAQERPANARGVVPRAGP